MCTSVRSLAGCPSSGSSCVKAVTGGAAAHAASSRRPLMVMLPLAGTACATGRSACDRGVCCAAPDPAVRGSRMIARAIDAMRRARIEFRDVLGDMLGLPPRFMGRRPVGQNRSPPVDCADYCGAIAAWGHADVTSDRHVSRVARTATRPSRESRFRTACALNGASKSPGVVSS